MKKFYLFSLLVILFLCTFPFSKGFAQNVGINKDGSTADSSAMLDIKNPNKGILIPRVALTGIGDITTIPSPATSLMVYNTTAAGTGATAVVAGYYYWDGTAWVRMVSSTTATNTAYKTLIPFASGGAITANTTPFTTNSVGLVGFGNSVTATLSNNTIALTLNYAFTVPSSGVITDISGLFTSSSITGSTVNIFINCQLYISTGNTFTPLASTGVTLSPGYSSSTPSGSVSTGTISGLNIPVAAGSRLLMVVAVNNSFMSLSTISGYFSGGVNMVIQ